MTRVHQPEKVSILGQESIVVDYGLWGPYIAHDLLQNFPASSYVLVTDYNLYDVYVPSFQRTFQNVAASLQKRSRLLTYQIPPGENSKSVGIWENIQRWMLSDARSPPCDTKTIVIALGGGVIGDLVGFAAAAFKRGIRFVQVPTSLLSMVDSSIGGKTAIDVEEGKNLVGAFWQPLRIYVDLQFLNTLPTRQLINGMAEVIKTAAIWDEAAFSRLDFNATALMRAIRSPPTQGPERLADVSKILKESVLGSIRVKAEVVTADEREGGLRNLLNFGHSIGHAIEGILAPEVLHGECVAVGMHLEAVLARYLGILDGGAVARLTKCLTAYGLPISLKDKGLVSHARGKTCSVHKLLTIMAVDKKNDGKQKRIVLLEKIGRTHERKASVVADKDIRVVLSSGISVRKPTKALHEVSCTPPGSKSISNRALVLAALSNGTCRIHNLLHSDDTEVMMNALTQLRGADFTWEDDGKILVVEGKGGRLVAGNDQLYLGNAGTASRFLTSVATLAEPGTKEFSILTGNARMKQRPIGPLVDALRANGADITYTKTADDLTYVEKTAEDLDMADGYCLPLRIKASRGMRGGEIHLDAKESSQYVSSILMSAPRAKTPVTLKMVGGPPISQPYIDMTTAMMASFGIHVKKSETEDHTYHIPKGEYTSPEDYTVESDASSATYPLAMAAISGTTCRVPNIGSRSLQGDSQFALKILKPMGCVVKQTESSTIVTGPPPGFLTPIEQVDMTTMTDAFLTASVLAATAQKRSSRPTTRITGIANQQKKECERISVMKEQLAKFGVTCRLWPDGGATPDGIEIDGINIKDLVKPSSGVHCYDDHRVAMSFSVLAAAAPSGALIRERECVGKTWPGWWDTMKQTFSADLEGEDLDNAVADSGRSGRNNILLIGMRGAGKTTAGRWAASVLGRRFTDLDEYLEETTKISIKDLQTKADWDNFRREELALLKYVMHHDTQGGLFACGGGIVESEEGRRLLTQYHQSGGLVILIERSIDDILEYLERDKTRPAYVAEHPSSVWARRKTWYRECSNLHYHSTRTPNTLFSPPTEFESFILNATGRNTLPGDLSRKESSFFVSLTLGDVSGSLDLLKGVAIGVDAVELRVDLLKEPGNEKGVPSPAFVIQQLANLRHAMGLPIIFTIRTQSQGGQWPDVAGKDSQDQVMELMKVAIRSAVEFVDVEMSLPENMLTEILSLKRNTKIIASHHDPQAKLLWTDAVWDTILQKAMAYGDIVKLVGVAKQLQDNISLSQFRARHETSSTKPMILINMGPAGEDSRVANTFLTPVSHPMLPFKAAPGQLSATEIRVKRSILGLIKPLQYFIFGKPVGQSRSPALHNTLFGEYGLPHSYRTMETDLARDLPTVIYSHDFGGASVTIPLKLDIISYLDETDEDAQVIGAVNTIVVDRSRPGPSHYGPRLIGLNTDWLGMRLVLEQAGAKASTDRSALIVGGGGTARAAIHTLHEMGYSPIYVVGRSPSKLRVLVETFSQEYNLYILTTLEASKYMSAPPGVAIGTIPADQPIDETMQAVLKSIFASSMSDGGGSDDGDTEDKAVHETKPILLEMAYKPAVTDLMSLAEAAGWATIPGLDVLAAQGLFQFEAWTGIKPPFSSARDIVKNGQTKS